MGTMFELPALPATDWLVILMTAEPELEDVFPGLLGEEEHSQVDEALIDGVLDLDEVYEACCTIIDAVSGRPWWVAMRLIEVARTNWHVLGAELLTNGVDSEQLSLSGWLDILLLLIMNRIDPKDAAMFTLRLEQPPADIEVEAKEPEMSASAFMSMA